MKYTFILFLFLHLTSIQLGYSGNYSLPDLEALIAAKNYSEAVAHLSDIPPTQRKEEWKKTVTQAVHGYASQLHSKNCQEAWSLMEASQEQYQFLMEDKMISKLSVTSGICTVKKGEFSNNDEQEKLVDQILKIDPSAIYPLVTEAGYIDYKDYFLRWINKNISLYKNDSKVKTFVINRSKQKYPKESEEITHMKVNLLKELGIENQVAADATKVLAQYCGEMMGGDFGNEFRAWKLVISLEQMNQLSGNLAARFYLPLLVVSPNSHERVIEKFKLLKPTDIARAEDEMLSAKTETNFWFRGGWNKSQIETLKKFLPKVTTLAGQECEQYRKNMEVNPVHMGTGACIQDGVFAK
jgi:hypothetical protein